MEDMIKKFFYTGIGVAALTAEKLQEAVDDLVGRGKVSEEEGKKIVDEFTEKTDTRREEFEGRLKDIVDNIRKGEFLPKFMTKEDMEILVKRIEALEEKISVGTEEDVKAVVKKTTKKATKATETKK
jgi:polyhydroxyalkanoate synthesis regulator phasin